MLIILPVSVIAHKNQNGVIQMAKLLKVFHPLVQIFVNDTNVIIRIMRKFAMKAKHEFRLIAIRIKNVCYIIHHDLQKAKKI